MWSRPRARVSAVWQRANALRTGRARLDKLATFYNNIKPDPAAEILQEGTLSDTTVAMLLQLLKPQHMAKIMASMNTNFAAGITKIMKELP
jgi:flagellar motility protein MotE (MotC chaperone)